MQLSKAELQVMVFLWRLEKGFLKDIIHLYQEPKPAPTTVATLLKRMKDKNAIGYETINNNRCYFPLVTKKAYFDLFLQDFITLYCNDSTKSFSKQLLASSIYSKSELKVLSKTIDKELKKRKKNT